MLSIVMPAYNEELTISDAVRDVAVHVVNVVPDSELIIVDDGSKDKTGLIVAGLQSDHAFVRLVTQPNGGHGAALSRGLKEANGDWILLLDSDCQISLADFGKHWADRHSYDAILGLRVPRHDPKFRLIVSLLMKSALRLFARVAPRDAGAPYKLVSRQRWLEASAMIRPGSWIPSVLLAAYLLKVPGAKVLEIPIIHFARPHGQSTLNPRRLVRFCWHAFGDILDFSSRNRKSLDGSHAVASGK